MTSYSEPAYDDTDTVESLARQLEETTGKLEQLLTFIGEELNACACEHCGSIERREHMLALFGAFIGTDGKLHPESSRWVCGFCLQAVCFNNGNRQEMRDRIGEWLVRGYGRTWLEELDSHYQHLGPGARQAPVARQLRVAFEAERMAAGKRLP